MLSSTLSLFPDSPSDSITLCKTLLQLLNSWDIHSSPQHLSAVRDDLIQATNQTLASETDDAAASRLSAVQGLVEHIGTAILKLTEGNGSSAAAAVSHTGELLRQLTLLDAARTEVITKKTDAARSSDVPQEADGAAPHDHCILFLQFGCETRRARHMNPLTTETLRETIVATFPALLGSPALQSGFPAVYIQDGPSQVWYQLEDLREVTDRTLLRIGNGVGGGKGRSDCLVQRQPTSHGPYTPNLISAMNDQQAQVQSLRKSLATLRRQYTQMQTSFEKEIKTMHAQARSLHGMLCLENGEARQAISTGMKVMSESSKSIKDRLEVLKEITETLRVDVSRRVRPGIEHMAALWDDAGRLSKDIVAVRSLADSARPKWKATWAKELEDIVAQQTFLSKQDDAAAQLQATHSDVMETLQTIQSVSDLLRDQDKDPGDAPVILCSTLTIEEAEHVKLAPVLSELKQAIRAERSSNRLESIQQGEKIRQWKRRAERDHGDHLQAQLQAVSLRDTGGVEEVERSRASKDAANLKITHT
ncbi:actin interacting protein 3-domain-containing protein [Powellomyces hirtus]|nr:actin interacting protein 3-domain-containing protein [Powellomyces hirtus]